MITTSAILIVCGAVCMGLCGFLLHKLRPQEGGVASAWTGTDTRGTAVALGLLLLMLAGVSLVVKGIIL